MTASVQVVMLHGAGMYSEALQRNLEHALHTALLLSPEKVSLEDFFAVLSGLSYEGPFSHTLHWPLMACLFVC